MRHLYFNLKDLFSNRKGFVILTSLLRFKNKSREFREYIKSTCNITDYLYSSKCQKKKDIKVRMHKRFRPRLKLVLD